MFHGARFKLREQVTERYTGRFKLREHVPERYRGSFKLQEQVPEGYRNSFKLGLTWSDRYAVSRGAFLHRTQVPWKQVPRRHGQVPRLPGSGTGSEAA